jgi:hypothetical protein
MGIPKTDWVQGIAPGSSVTLIAMNVDIVHSSQWKGAALRIQETKKRFLQLVQAFVCSAFDAHCMSVHGDGALFLFPIADSHSYDRAVLAGQTALHTLSLFNSTRPYYSLIDSAISARITSHVCTLVWDATPGHIQGADLDFLMKFERHIGRPSKFVITDAVYAQIYEPALRDCFVELPGAREEGVPAFKAYTCNSPLSHALLRYSDLQPLQSVVERVSAYDDIFGRHADALIKQLRESLETLQNRSFLATTNTELLQWMRYLYDPDETNAISSLCRLEPAHWSRWSRGNFPEDFTALNIAAVRKGTRVARVFLASNLFTCLQDWLDLLCLQAEGGVDLRILEVDRTSAVLPEHDFAIYESTSSAKSYIAESLPDANNPEGGVTHISSGEKVEWFRQTFHRLWNTEPENGLVEVKAVDTPRFDEPSVVAVAGLQCSVRELAADAVLLRRMRPLSSALPTFEQLCLDAHVPAKIAPRKCDANYARLMLSLTRLTSSRDPQAFFYFGDSINNDGSVMCHLARLSGRPVYGFLCNESREEEGRLVLFDGISVSNRWFHLGRFIEACIKVRGAVVDSSVAVLLDMDRTIFGAAGRNHIPLQTARQSAVEKVSTEIVNLPEELAAFRNAYTRLDSARFHKLTLDNQDYLVFVALMCAKGLVDLEEICSRVVDEATYDFGSCFAEIAKYARAEASTTGAENAVTRLVSAFADALNQRDPTPFKRFRDIERVETLARLARGTDGTDDDLESLLKSKIVLTREIVDAAEWFRSVGCRVFVVSDRPEESTIPPGYVLSSDLNTDSLVDVRLQVVGSDAVKETCRRL